MVHATQIDWQAVLDDDARVPSEPPLADLTAELTALLGSPDPRNRDAVALELLLTWVDRGVYDDLLVALGDGMAAGLRVGLGEQETDTVFRRSFSALVLAECVARDTARPLVLRATLLDWADAIATWLLGERDLRSWVPGKGWAHAVAHGADAIGILARSPHFAVSELTVLLDVLGERAVLAADRVLVSGEPDRLALATIEVLRRDRISAEQIETWATRLVDTALAARRSGAGTGRDPYLVSGNLEAYLRALHLQLLLGPRPPRCRTDAILALVEALRRLAPAFLGPSPADSTAGRA